ncbi:MAG: hypothetical protein KAI51_04570 [Candidatus Aenigmarchaeota archaeon]|nr:hypothetical protein [Candidatus Aenigmarchaeota archaeon]MCK5042976.1 hypothetical protein [Candidatus Aenigmarchaeota archaeon]MCK5062894.1 hypothetical protein [Candidatus Aenigmarchaeota archaeon]MCK5289686.1 hypothetical protein [Candidatus Aenigmarchaeota archaeon]MCK5452689.1 hypothetical protein [Candidatus Aenigmarchaeota archaeon]
MFITTIELMAKGGKEEIKKRLDTSEMISDYEIDAETKENSRKNVILSFSNPVDTRYVAPAIQTLLN